MSLFSSQTEQKHHCSLLDPYLVVVCCFVSLMRSRERSRVVDTIVACLEESEPAARRATSPLQIFLWLTMIGGQSFPELAPNIFFPLNDIPLLFGKGYDWTWMTISCHHEQLTIMFRDQCGKVSSNSDHPQLACPNHCDCSASTRQCHGPDSGIE